MKIIGGSFGSQGDAFITRDNRLSIEAPKPATYEPQQITEITTETRTSTGFASLGFIIGACLFSAIGFAMLGLIGAAIGLAIALAASFFKDSANIASLQFSDGNTLTLECTPRAMKKLITLTS